MLRARAGASSTARDGAAPGDTTLVSGGSHAGSKLLRSMIRVYFDLAVRAQQALIGQGIAEVDALVSSNEETSCTLPADWCCHVRCSCLVE